MSEQIIKKEVPQHLGRWNWGAFLLSWIWGIGNSVWISFLTFIPLFGIIWIFVLGFKGNKWAWEKGRWDNLDHFKRVQRNWSIAGFIVWGCFIIFWAILFFILIHIMNNNWVVKNSLIQVQNNVQVQRVLGTPIERSSWLTQGNISVSNGQGSAVLKYNIKGPTDQATIYVNAKKYNGQWKMLHLIVVPKQAQRIDIINQSAY